MDKIVNSARFDWLYKKQERQTLFYDRWNKETPLKIKSNLEFRYSNLKFTISVLYSAVAYPTDGVACQHISQPWPNPSDELHQSDSYRPCVCVCEKWVSCVCSVLFFSVVFRFSSFFSCFFFFLFFRSHSFGSITQSVSRRSCFQINKNAHWQIKYTSLSISVLFGSLGYSLLFVLL